MFPSPTPQKKIHGALSLILLGAKEDRPGLDDELPGELRADCGDADPGKPAAPPAGRQHAPQEVSAKEGKRGQTCAYNINNLT